MTNLHILIFVFSFFAGKSTVNNEKGRNSDEKSQIVIQIKEEERRWRMSSDR